MRIVSGIYRHRNIIYPEASEFIRPTKDRIREAIFSAIGDLKDKMVLDLYSGSGAMGIEALSRNAKYAYFVDINPIAIDCTKNNLNNLKISNAQVIKSKDFDALEKFANDKLVFDLVILDPPYKEGRYLDLVSYLFEHNLLSNHSIIVIERDREIETISYPINKMKTYSYGKIKVDIIWR